MIPSSTKKKFKPIYSFFKHFNNEIRNPIFHDQTKSFLQKAEYCIKESLEVDMKILAPLIDIEKSEIYVLSKHYNLPIRDTYYCHSGEKEPCGKCIACLEHMNVNDTIKNGV